MKHRNTFVIITAFALTLAASGTALAAKGGAKPAPPPEPTTWTCQARVDNGAIWVLGEPTGTGYTVVGLPACIDLRAEDTVPHRWRVDWEGTVARAPIKGLEFRFETGVHGVIYAQTIATDTGGTWITGVLDPPEDAFAFVAMPHVKDRWSSITITVTPLPPEE